MVTTGRKIPCELRATADQKSFYTSTSLDTKLNVTQNAEFLCASEMTVDQKSIQACTSYNTTWQEKDYTTRKPRLE